MLTNPIPDELDPNTQTRNPKPPVNTWDRLLNESMRAYRAFLVYLGLRRTFREAYTNTKSKKSDKTATKRYKTASVLGHWSKFEGHSLATKFWASSQGRCHTKLENLALFFNGLTLLTVKQGESRARTMRRYAAKNS